MNILFIFPAEREMNIANPKIYGMLGLILVAVPMLFFFVAGLPYSESGETLYANGTTTYYSGIVWKGAFNPSLLIFVFLAGTAAFGCYRNKLVAWVGSVLLLILCIIAGFSVGLFGLPGTIILFVGALLKSYENYSVPRRPI